MKAFYPGSFDPITNGHMDIIQRSRVCFASVIVGVSASDGKLPIFSYEERLDLAKKVTSDIPDVTVRGFSGLTVEAARESECNILIRGLRVVSDYDYEMQLALMNKSLADDIETVFLVSSHKYIFVSSTVIREIAKHGGETCKFVPAVVEEALRAKYSS